MSFIHHSKTKQYNNSIVAASVLLCIQPEMLNSLLEGQEGYQNLLIEIKSLKGQLENERKKAKSIKLEINKFLSENE